MLDDNNGRITKPRSRQACNRCHARRVRCDASVQGIPCSGCIASNLSGACRLIESRKGRDGSGRFSTRTNSSGSVTRSQPPAGPESETRSTTLAVSPDSTVQEQQGSIEAGQGADEPELIQRPASEADQWSKIVSQDVVRSMKDSRRITYVGESWNLSYMMQWKSHAAALNDSNDSRFQHTSPSETTDGDSPCFHIPMPSQQDTRSSRPANQFGTRQDQILPSHVQLAMIDAYFAYHHVHYPIVAEQEFQASLADKSVSPLLLSAVLYAGAIHVSDQVIYRAGFDSRQVCLKKLYHHSKMIFFTDDENAEICDQLSRVQTAFLLHHMWLSPNSTMDCWNWLSLTVRLAQNMGMHRSTTRTSMAEEDKKLWKRIWWSLYARDTQLASGVGKPLIINDLDCDVEPLSENDFEIRHSPEMRMFVIEQARLAVVCRQVIRSRFAPGIKDQAEDEHSKKELMTSLIAWRESLPEVLQYGRTRDPCHTPLQAPLIHVLYNNILLLVHRPRFVPSNTQTAMQNENASWKIVHEAAGAITDITGYIMNYKSMYHCPIFYTSALFGAMTMHAIRGRAAEHQLGLCMVAMRTLGAMYTNAEWVRTIFQKLSEKTRSFISAAPSGAPTRSSSPARDKDGKQASVISPPLLSPLASDTQPGPAGSMQEIRYPELARGIGVEIYSHMEHHDHGPMLFPHVNPLGHPILPAFSMPEDLETNSLESGLEVSWRDLACLDGHFSNPFIFSTSFRM